MISTTTVAQTIPSIVTRLIEVEELVNEAALTLFFVVPCAVCATAASAAVVSVAVVLPVSAAAAVEEEEEEVAEQN